MRSVISDSTWRMERKNIMALKCDARTRPRRWGGSFGGLGETCASAVMNHHGAYFQKGHLLGYTSVAEVWVFDALN